MLPTETVLEVRKIVIGVCEIFHSRKDAFPSDFTETGKQADYPGTDWVRRRLTGF